MPFPLLALPAELRNQIYHMALTRPSAIILAGRTRSPPRTTALLRSSRQLHSEAAPVLYGANTFGFLGTRGYNTLLYFLRLIGPRNARCLRRVAVLWPAVARCGAAGVVQAAVRSLGELCAAGLVLHIYHHAQCPTAIPSTTTNALPSNSCHQAHLATVQFLDQLSAQKVFHASPRDTWAAGRHAHYSGIIREMRRRGWTVRLYDADCLDPGAEAAGEYFEEAGRLCCGEEESSSSGGDVI